MGAISAAGATHHHHAFSLLEVKRLPSARNDLQVATKLKILKVKELKLAAVSLDCDLCLFWLYARRLVPDAHAMQSHVITCASLDMLILVQGLLIHG